jgi:hypothetical protein
MVAELIKKNRQLQRQVATLTAKARASRATKGVERGLRTISRRVQRALGATTKRRRRTTAAPANGRKRKTTTKASTTRRRRTS